MHISSNGSVSRLLWEVPIPHMFQAQQQFDESCIAPEDIPKVVFQQLALPRFNEKIQPGMQIAITAGSRGIANVDIITKAVVDFVKKKGANPFIVPAMGSHGGATAAGQVEVLESYGITPERMGCPIRSGMEVVELGISSTGKRVYLDKYACQSDGIIVSCRLKPHNAFRGDYESGPCKMMTVGLGKQAGAELVHSDGMDNIAANIPSMAQVVLEKAPILLALPCVENAYDQTRLIEAIAPEDILRRERELLQFAFSQMPRILVEEGEVLIVDEIGKNYSGTGVDPNITGTFSTPYASGGVKVQRTCMLSLSEASHGNALGVGLASAITRRIFDAIDGDKLYPNCITSTVIKSACIPPVMSTDKEAIQFCIRTCNKITPEQARVIRIKNSLHIGKIMLSQHYYNDVQAGKYPGLVPLDEPRELPFSHAGELAAF